MIPKPLFTAILTTAIALTFCPRPTRAEDFSIHLDEITQVDAKKPLPECAFDRLTPREPDNGTPDMPRRTLDIYLRFKNFGDVYLDQGYAEGPSIGKLYNKGQIFVGGLADLNEVKLGWIKNSPDLFIVGWLNEHGSGNSPEPDHEFALLQLKDGHSKILLRRTCPCGIRANEFNQGSPLETARFTWNPKTNRLIETITSTRIVTAEKPAPLLHPQPLDESGIKEFSTELRETITLEYQLENDKLTPQSATLSYTASKDTTLADIAAFYLAGESQNGQPQSKPFKDQPAALQALLNANPQLKTPTPTTPLLLPQSEKITIPLPINQIMNAANGLGITAILK